MLYAMGGRDVANVPFLRTYYMNEPPYVMDDCRGMKSFLVFKILTTGCFFKRYCNN